jgi:hypothetical protein
MFNMKREVECRERSWKVMSDDYTHNVSSLKEQLEKKDTEARLCWEDINKKLSLRECELSNQYKQNNDLKLEMTQLSSELSHTQK